MPRDQAHDALRCSKKLHHKSSTTCLLCTHVECPSTARKKATTHQTSSKEIRLLHDAQKLFFVHLAIAIAVSLINHFLKLLGNTLQILERDLTSLVVVKQTERLQNLVFGITIEDLVGHHLEKFFILNRPTAVVIDI